MNDIFATLYELIRGQDSELSKLLYDGGTYVPVGWLMLTFSLLGMVVYYYVFNHPKFNRWFHWLFLPVAIICLINFAIAYFMADGVVWDAFGKTDGYVSQIIGFACVNAFWTFIFSLIISMCIKWKSTNAKHSPF